jgi:hypothetical protein
MAKHDERIIVDIAPAEAEALRSAHIRRRTHCGACFRPSGRGSGYYSDHYSGCSAEPYDAIPRR